MNELGTFAERWGPWVAVFVYVIAKVIPAFVERFLPQMMTQHRDDDVARRVGEVNDRAALIAVYEKFIEQNNGMIQFIGESTVVLSGVERALEHNTRAIYKSISKDQPDCSVTDCPFKMGTSDVSK